MTLFFRRFMGALSLDPGAFEDIEASPSADLQSILVVVLASLAGGVAVVGLGAASVTGFVGGAVIVLAGWLLWAAAISAIGTTTLAGAETRSDVHELLRVLGYATAPGVFLALAILRTAAPLLIVMVAIWIIAAAVLGVRQALDFRSTSRAVAVCVIAFMVAGGVMTVVFLLFSSNVT